jgi:hypothetical protein
LIFFKKLYRNFKLFPTATTPCNFHHNSRLFSPLFCVSLLYACCRYCCDISKWKFSILYKASVTTMMTIIRNACKGSRRLRCQLLSHALIKKERKWGKPFSRISLFFLWSHVRICFWGLKWNFIKKFAVKISCNTLCYIKGTVINKSSSTFLFNKISIDIFSHSQCVTFILDIT